MKVHRQIIKGQQSLNRFRVVLVFCVFSIAGCAQTGLIGSQESAPIESRSTAEQTPPPAQASSAATIPTVEKDPVVNISPLEEEGVGLPIPIDERGAEDSAVPIVKGAPAGALVQSNPATEQILGDAQAALIRGDLLAAESVTNRGLRIAPKDPALWLQLAKIRLGQGQYLEAISLSERAQVLAVKNPAAEIDALEIIATAQESVGDSAKAAATREKILKLSGEMGIH